MSRPRLTGGHLRGRSLAFPVPDGARPTSSRVREALFSILGQDLSGVRFLDAFGGAGLVGLEARSRGADVAIVERDRRRAALIRRQAEALGVRSGVRVLGRDVLRAVEGLGPFQMVFADPPYAFEPGEILDRLAAATTDWLVYESESRGEPPVPEALELYGVRTYGRSVLWVYRAIE